MLHIPVQAGPLSAQYQYVLIPLWADNPIHVWLHQYMHCRWMGFNIVHHSVSQLVSSPLRVSDGYIFVLQINA